MNLPWLPRKPADFRAQVRALGDQVEPGRAVQALAWHDLDDAAAASLSKQIVNLRQAGVSLEPLSALRIGLLSSGTFDLVADVLPAAAARHGVDLEIVLAPYDQVPQQALDPDSMVNSAQCDAVLVAVDHRWLRFDRPRLSEGAANACVGESFGLVESLATALEAAGSVPILPVVATPAEFLFGHIDRRIPGSPRAMIDAFNRHVIRLASDRGYYLLDIAALAERVGSANWFSSTQWNLFKLPFSGDFNGLYADAIGRVVGAIRGKSRKCLVLDLDNTVWGGVVGDDGVEALKIGQGNAEGEGHLAVQKLALDLRERGIVLSVCSKNFDETARRPFREHPDMLLKEEHIAVFQANWVDKASNLEAIAKTLNIGLDALVLCDDNPAERAQLRAALPMVAVPELPSDVSQFAPTLAASGLFEAVGFSTDDLIRANAYAADAKRAEVMATTRDLGDYLTALEMVISHAPFEAVGRQRIAQLINKSNQFNLTTRRYTEAEVAAMEHDSEVFTLQSRLRDRFGDQGMISVIIARLDEWRGEVAWVFDSWLMSCRVLGRKVEEAVLDQTICGAREAGTRYLIGRYLPTAKNGMVKDHYRTLGFELIDELDSREERWVLDLETYTKPALPMVVETTTSFTSE